MSGGTGSSIGIVGAGIGGLAAAIALSREGHRVEIFEQAPAFGRVGAAITVSPNALRALDGLGVGALVREWGCRPPKRVNRAYDTGEVFSELALAAQAERDFGAPLITMHRSELLGALEESIPPGSVRFGSRLAGLDQDDDGVLLRFDDGTEHRVDAVVGADGVRSTVRQRLRADEAPAVFTGSVAFRATIPVDRVPSYDVDAFTKWWGPVPESEIVTFPIHRSRELFVFASALTSSWDEESWTREGDVDELRAAFADYHDDARELIAQCDSTLITALYDRHPLDSWTSGRVALLGDACHPMTPFMAQGAAMAIEDAVVLGRSLAGRGPDTLAAGLEVYARTRMPRASRVQLTSHSNQWLREPSDANWVYGHDIWAEQLAG